MNRRVLRRFDPSEIASHAREPFDARTLDEASAIVEAVRTGGEAALRRTCERFGELAPGAPLVLDQTDMAAALARVPREVRDVLERTAARIRDFALAQRACLKELDAEVVAGRAGHTIAPIERAGCYAPGGRFPLPSSALMTAVTARAAGVEHVVVASPKPTDVTLAAAAVAGADAFLPIGGAQAIAALTFGVGGIEPRDLLVGPGNRWVTAAKHAVSWRVGIDMLAGPSELLIIADESANPDVVAADLLAQAEHDTDAVPLLVSTSDGLIEAVEEQLHARLATLPTRETALVALGNGGAVLATSMDEALRLSDMLAPEHLQVMTRSAASDMARLRHYGAVFVGSASAEVLGDYGVGPNHVLPTGGTSRRTGGLSVFTFLRVRTWLRCDPGHAQYPSALRDAAALARLEGLEGHARAADARLR